MPTTVPLRTSTVLAAVAAMLASFVILLAPSAGAVDVSLLQRDLAGLSYAPLYAVDGVYGSRTTESVRHFQRDNGLAVDGAAGTNTMNALTTRVKQVQSKAAVTADGDYGSGTLAAVRSYQARHGLEADGIAGPRTMAAMDIDRIPASGPGSSTDTGRLQRDLAGLAYLPLSGVDGTYGAQTKNAVLSFQSDNNLPVNGIADPATLAALVAKVKRVQSKTGATADGDYGQGTITAVKAYQSGHGLTADGLAGPDTMAALGIAREVGGDTDGGESGGTPPDPPTSGTTREKILQAARSQLGVQEWGNNCNPYGPCEYWCALFASWTWRKGGINFSTAFSGAFYTYGTNHGTLHSGLSNPQPGDAIMFGTGPQNTSTSVHVGIIEQVLSDGRVISIEGNHNNRVERVGPYAPSTRGAYAITSP